MWGTAGDDDMGNGRQGTPPDNDDDKASAGQMAHG